MAKKKRKRIIELNSLENVFQDPALLRSEWRRYIFRNENPITVELGCGKGDYTLELARRYPRQNFVGIDMKGPRLFVGAQQALTEGLENVRFLRANISELERHFKHDTISTIWITFSDPYPRKPRKRLTSSIFLQRYQTVTVRDAVLHFKTDDPDFYKFSLQSISKFGCSILYNTENLYAEPDADELMTIKTVYEQRHLTDGKTIKYIRFKLPSAT